MSFEEEYFDVLRSIEEGIVRAYAAVPESKDRHVDKAIGSLVRYYNAALKEKKPPNIKLNPQDKTLYDSVKAALEAHMSGDGLTENFRLVTLEEGVLCLKRIKKSVEQMMKLHGQSGNHYLEFVKGYLNKDKPKNL
ncbi:MAG: hypothetical protein AAFV33_05020 [Chloroflexota bacterium]